MLAVYVSGHGYGHSTRTAEVLRLVRDLAPDLPLTVVTEAPEGLFREAIPGDFAYRKVGLDVGIVQSHALGLDLEATLVRLRQLDEAWSARVDEEARWLEASGAGLVLADIPAVAFDAAFEADVPSIALGNFSWDWIYEHLARSRDAFAPHAARARQAQGRCDLLLELPFAGDLTTFPRRERIPLVARRPLRSRGQARARLSLDPLGRVVLMSFGGLGLDALDLRSLRSMKQTTFLAESAGSGEAANLRRFDRSELHSLGLRYLDLVAAADVVVTKPGYGIVTDALACGTRIVYTDRGDFPEYPILVREMEPLIPAQYITNEDLMAGRLEEALGLVMSREIPKVPRLDGAKVAARRILEMLDRSR